MEDFFKLTILFKNCRQPFGEMGLINIAAYTTATLKIVSDYMGK